jgi:beta-lactamase class A
MRRLGWLAMICALATAQESNLAQQIAQRMAATEGKVWLYAKNLDTGAEFGLRPDEPVRTASTIKLAVMVHAFDQVAKGKARWDEMLLLRDQDKVTGSGVLHEFSGGVRLPLRDVMHLMIVVSDNTATNLLVDRFSADAVNETMDRLGFKATRLMRKVRGDGPVLAEASGFSKAGLDKATERFGLGRSSPREMVRLMELLERGQVVNAEASRQMLEVLKRQQFKDGIGRRVTEPVASKSGALDRLRSDVGVVYTKRGRVAIAITVDDLPKTDYSEDNAGLSLIADLARTLVAELAR